MAGPDGIYRDENGKAIGRRVADGFIVDDGVLPGEKSATEKDAPRLCPDPGPDVPHGASDRAVQYQSQISGLPPGLAVWLNGVAFDGCRESDGTMLEAKGPAYEQLLGMMKNGIRVKAYSDAIDQAARQVDAAGDRAIEWHFAERSAADFFREKFTGTLLGKIIVIYTPQSEK